MTLRVLSLGSVNAVISRFSHVYRRLSFDRHAYLPINFLVDGAVHPIHSQASATPAELGLSASKASQQLLPVMLGKTDLVTWLNCKAPQRDDARSADPNSQVGPTSDIVI